jgi:hypothetical protein
MTRSVPLAPACLLLLFAAALHADENQLRQDEAALMNAGIRTDGPGLLAFYRQHTTTSADETTIRKLVTEMGDDRFRVRERASGQLTSLGNKAVPFLQAALKNTDLEISRRAERCLSQIEHGASEALLVSAARLVAARKPDGADRVLLDYLAGADKEHLIEATLDALVALARAGGKPNPLLVEALAEKNPRRRAAAAVALTRAGDTDTRPAVRKLLADSDSSVRLRVGLALAWAKEKESLPTLVQLLGELPPNDTGPIEDLLYRLAGEDAPTVPRGSTEEEGKKFRAAWEEWLKGKKDKLDLAKLTEEAKPRGHTLLVLLEASRIVDLDEKNRERFRINDVAFPLDAQYLPGDRVLVAEYNGGRVTERNSKGEVAWEHKIDQPLVAQRLPGGNTFIATATQLVEVDKAGKVVWNQPPPRGGRIMKATRLRNGDTAVITLLGVSRFIQIDKNAKEVRSFGVDQRTSGGRVEILGNGNVLLSDRDTNRVVEVDYQGKPVWEASLDQPIAAVRLPSGNTLVTFMNAQRAVEVDRKGKQVWEYNAGTRVTRAWRH